MCLITEEQQTKLDLVAFQELIKFESVDPPIKLDPEVRREKCKLAARSRRGTESELFQGLADSLPISKKSRDALDKPSILKLTVADLKLQQLMSSLQQHAKFAQHSECSKIDSAFDYLVPNVVNGFTITMSSEGEISFVSSNISTYLGLNQLDVMGKSIFDLSHPCDHNEMKEMLIQNKVKVNNSEKRSALIRLNCTNLSRGHNSNHPTYKLVCISGKLHFDTDIGFIGLCELIPSPSDPDFITNEDILFTKHSVEMKFTQPKNNCGLQIGGFSFSELNGKSFFDFVHASDAQYVAKIFKSLYMKGQVKTNQYKFLVKGGGWIWISTEATLLNSSGKPSQREIACRHFILSEVENPYEILSEVQYSTFPIVPEISISDLTATEKCNLKSTDECLTKCNDHEIDLEHLAPVAGDGSVPLNDELYEELLKFFENSNCSSIINSPTSSEAQLPVISENDYFVCQEREDIKPFYLPQADCSKVPSMYNNLNFGKRKISMPNLSFSQLQLEIPSDYDFKRRRCSEELPKDISSLLFSNC